MKNADVIGGVSFTWRDALFAPVLIALVVPTALVWGLTSQIGPGYLWQILLLGAVFGLLGGAGFYLVGLGETVRKAAHWEMGMKSFATPLFSPEELAQLQTLKPQVLQGIEESAHGLNLRLRKLVETGGKGWTPQARAEWLRGHLKSREVREWKEQAEALRLWIGMIRKGTSPVQQTKLRLVKK